MDKNRKTKVLLLLLSLCGNLIQRCYLGYHYHSTLTAGTYVEERIPSLTRKILLFPTMFFSIIPLKSKGHWHRALMKSKGKICAFSMMRMAVFPAAGC